MSSACALISERIVAPIQTSSLYESDPWGFKDPTPFYNMVVEIKTVLSPKGILKEIREIESALGRTRAVCATRRADGNKKIYEPRTIDIDILFYDSKIINLDDLMIPHPRLHERKFILIPMAEIAPDFIHPVLKKTIGDLLTSCHDTGKVTCLKRQRQYGKS